MEDTESILPQLEKNKGTVSSALGKALAKDVLAGEDHILAEAVELLSHGDKQVRAGAAKIIEQVAAADPALVAPYLPQLLPALDVPESQTRWMTIHTLGLCAALDEPTARQALPKAEAFLEGQSGACLWGATIRYLGYLGAESPANARAMFPILEQSLQTLPRQTKNVLDSFQRILDQTTDETRAEIARYADAYVRDARPSVRTAARKLQDLLSNRRESQRLRSCRREKRAQRATPVPRKEGKRPPTAQPQPISVQSYPENDSPLEGRQRGACPEG